MSDVTQKRNSAFDGLCNKKLVTEKELKYFSYNFKNACCPDKMYLLPKIRKRSFDISGRPVISNCGTPTEKMSEFLYHHLQPVMKGGRSYVKDTQNFLENFKHQGKVPSNATLITTDVVGLYPSIPYEAGLEGLQEKLEERMEQNMPSSNLANMAEFILKNNYFEFDSKVKKQMFGTAIGTAFAPPYACIFMDKGESEFLEAVDIKPWVWFRYIDDIFFIWTESKNKLEGFLQCLNTC